MQKEEPIKSESESVRSYLRRITHPVHEQLDALGETSNMYSPDGYARFLQKHAVALFPLEQQLESSGIDTFVEDWEHRSRRESLAKDLAALSLEVPQQDVRSMTLTPAEMLGAVYVLEGSRFGNRMIHSTIVKQHGTHQRFPVAYISHGTSSELWQKFLSNLESSDNDRTEIAKGAMMAFERFLVSWKEN